MMLEHQNQMLFFQLLKQLAADPSYNKVISVGRRKVVPSSVPLFFCIPLFQVDLPSEPGMEKVVQEEVNFDNLSEYSSAFPRFPRPSLASKSLISSQS